MSAQNPDPIAKRSGTAACLRGLSPLLAGVLVAALLVPSSTALGRDESGMYDVLLGRNPAAVYHAAVPVDLAPVERKRRPRPSRVARAPAERRDLTASLASSDWLAAILADDTLRPRDIVVFPEGPKVFVGNGFGPPWSTSDFEDVATSRAVDNRSREAIRSVVGTRGGLEFAAIAPRKSPLQVAISDRQAGKN